MTQRVGWVENPTNPQAVWNLGFGNPTYAVSECSSCHFFLHFTICIRLAALSAYFFKWVFGYPSKVSTSSPLRLLPYAMYKKMRISTRYAPSLQRRNRGEISSRIGDLMGAILRWCFICVNTCCAFFVCFVLKTTKKQHENQIFCSVFFVSAPA